MHRHRYHGVLAQNANWQSQVTALGRPEPDDLASEGGDVPAHPATTQAPHPTWPNGTTSASRSGRRAPHEVWSWAQLLARIYELLPLLYPTCGGEMKIISFLTDPPTVQAILRRLDLPDEFDEFED